MTNMRNRTGRSHALLGAVGTMALAAATASIPAAASAETIRASMTGALRVLDPILSGTYITRSHGYMVYDTLLGLDDTFTPRPQMADWTVSDDGLVYTFRLRDGLKWHDGTAVTAEDCVASIRRWQQRDALGAKLDAVTETLAAADERTIVLTLKEPVGFVLDALSKTAAPVPFMMPKRLAETPVTEAIPEQIGSGPFRFVAEEFEPGSRTVYVRNEDYVPREEAPNWTSGGKVVEVDRVEWIVMPDAQTAINAAITGEIDYVDEPALDLLPMVEGQAGVRLETLNPAGLMIFGRMNFVAGPFTDVRVRKAAMSAMWQKPFLSAIAGDERFYRECNAYFTCDTPFSVPLASDALVDGGGIEEAKRLLAEAGYDGEEIRILQPTDSNTQKMQPLVGAQMLRDAGFNVKLLPSDFQTSFASRATYANAEKRDYDLFFSALGGFDVSSPLTSPLIAAAGAKSYGGYPDDPVIEQLRDEFARTADVEKRKGIARAIQDRAHDQVIYIPLGFVGTPAIVGERLGPMVPGPSAPYFWGVGKSE